MRVGFLMTVGVVCSWLSTAPVSAAEFFVLPGTQSLLMMGETVPEDFNEFQKFVSDGQIDTVVLRGPGGALETAFQIADQIQAKGLNTVVAEKSDCASACSLIFVAGKKRHMGEGARLGFHLPFLSITSDEVYDYCTGIAPPLGDDTFDQDRMEAFLKSQLGVSSGLDPRCLMETYRMGFRDLSKISKMMTDSGISSDVFDVMLDTPPGGMSWFSAEDATEKNLVN